MAPKQPAIADRAVSHCGTDDVSPPPWELLLPLLFEGTALRVSAACSCSEVGRSAAGEAAASVTPRTPELSRVAATTKSAATRSRRGLIPETLCTGLQRANNISIDAGMDTLTAGASSGCRAGRERLGLVKRLVRTPHVNGEQAGQLPARAQQRGLVRRGRRANGEPPPAT